MHSGYLKFRWLAHREKSRHYVPPIVETYHTTVRQTGQEVEPESAQIPDLKTSLEEIQGTWEHFK